MTLFERRRAPILIMEVPPSTERAVCREHGLRYDPQSSVGCVHESHFADKKPVFDSIVSHAKLHAPNAAL